jgi:hypothetical protein
MDLAPSEQRLDPPALGLEGSRPGRVVIDDLNTRVWPTGVRKVFCCCTAAIGG